jgi:hypothetical protein
VNKDYLNKLITSIGESIALSVDREIVEDVLKNMNRSKKFYSHLQYKGDQNMNGEFTLMVYENKNYNA